MTIGDLFYWKGKVLCEFIGRDVLRPGKFAFRTINGGIISLYPEQVLKDMTKEESE